MRICTFQSVSAISIHPPPHKAGYTLSKVVFCTDSLQKLSAGHRSPCFYVTKKNNFPIFNGCAIREGIIGMRKNKK